MMGHHKNPIDSKGVTNALIAAFVALALMLTLALLSVRTADAQETVSLLERSMILEQELRFEALRLFLWNAANESGNMEHFQAVSSHIAQTERFWSEAADRLAMYFVEIEWAVYAVETWADAYGTPQVVPLATDVAATAEIHAASGI